MSELPDFEKMDLFYLGRELDPQNGKTSVVPLLYKNKNLTTHAVILGMTGSGKTGLGIALLEEAALDKIPALIIDPKGDMSNLLLSFPDLEPKDFEPWIDSDKARQKGMSREELARQTAAEWEQGLSFWGESKERIARMHEHANFAVYTPGSGEGQPVSVLDSLKAPDPSTAADEETLAGLVNSAVSSLLVLVGIDADPLKSRQHILLSSILLYHWRRGEHLDLESLIGSVVKPPFSKIGVFPLESFYPQPKRMDLAMQLNNIVASPSFSGWTQGVPMDIDSFLYTGEGKPQHAIFTLSHLGDEERMFFVTMLLGRLLGWMRQQEGSSSLRCLLYMDEIFGYFPPSANPPAKKAMMLLLKQARAFGVGIVLSTQNPVDLDYKGLSNIGTWFIGRLQTHQDQDRVLAGISGSSEQLDKPKLRNLLRDMRGRTFLFSSTHRQEPILFETRWVLSYLKGPISLQDIDKLIEKSTEDQNVAKEVKQKGTQERFSDMMPILPGTLAQFFIPSPVPMEQVLYSPWLIGTAQVRFFNQRRNIDQETTVCLRLPAGFAATLDWQEADYCLMPPEEGMSSPQSGGSFYQVSVELSGPGRFSSLKKEFSDFLYHSRKLELFRVVPLKLESRPGESLEQFHQRLASILREKKDTESATIEDRFQKKQQQLQVRLEKAMARLDKEKEDVRSRGVDTALSFGVAIFGALFGGKGLSVANATRSARGVRSAGRLLKEKGDVQRAEQEIERIEQDLQTLSSELQEKFNGVAERFDPAQYTVETFSITPRRSDIFSVRLYLLWEPNFDLSPEAMG